MFSDESKFLLERQDGRKRVFRRVNKRFVPQCLSQARAFGGGSVMVWGGITAAGTARIEVKKDSFTTLCETSRPLFDSVHYDFVCVTTESAESIVLSGFPLNELCSVDVSLGKRQQ
ncbi:transposable element Tcb2 transposase [Elysia marginata]|uniref:Transposable element Tcb2 transposase n=1 Tax=Elysia marginata TaxID=1093978 RepID=A0AAV4GI17_9GAST|nr:transposable element Tcb2 transposase [Elysia marginata]